VVECRALLIECRALLIERRGGVMEKTIEEDIDIYIHLFFPREINGGYIYIHIHYICRGGSMKKTYIYIIHLFFSKGDQ